MNHVPHENRRAALVVDDDPDICSLLSRFLRPWGLEVVTANSSAEAHSLSSLREFDLYLIDLQLSDTDSAEFVQSLRNRGASILDRCVMVTAFPLLANALGKIPVIAKTELASLGPHLVRILGAPPRSRETQ